MHPAARIGHCIFLPVPLMLSLNDQKQLEVLVYLYERDEVRLKT